MSESPRIPGEDAEWIVMLTKPSTVEPFRVAFTKSVTEPGMFAARKLTEPPVEEESDPNEVFDNHQA